MNRLKDLNLFGNQLDLNLKGKLTFKTYYGTFVTILMIAILIIISWGDIIQYFTLSDPSIDVLEEIINEQEVFLNKKDNLNDYHILLFNNKINRFYQEDEMLDYITPFAYTLDSNSSDPSKTTTRIDPLVPCKSVKEINDRLRPHPGFCLPKALTDQQYFLQNTKAKYRDIVIHVKPCDSTKRVCKVNPQNLSSLQVVANYMQSVFDPRSIKQPITRTEGNLIISLSGTLQNKFMVEYSNFVVNDKFGVEVPSYLMRSQEEQQEVYHSVQQITSSVSSRDVTSVQCSSGTNTISQSVCSSLLTISLGFSKKKFNNNRTYLSLFQLLGNLAGFFEFLVLLGVILTKLDQELPFKYYIVDMFYGKEFIRKEIGYKSYWAFFSSNFWFLRIILCKIRSKKKLKKQQLSDQRQGEEQSSQESEASSQQNQLSPQEKFSICYESIVRSFDSYDIIIMGIQKILKLKFDDLNQNDSLKRSLLAFYRLSLIDHQNDIKEKELTKLNKKSKNSQLRALSHNSNKVSDSSSDKDNKGRESQTIDKDKGSADQQALKNDNPKITLISQIFQQGQIKNEENSKEKAKEKEEVLQDQDKSKINYKQFLKAILDSSSSRTKEVGLRQPEKPIIKSIAEDSQWHE